MSDIEKYFDRYVFAGLALILPSTIILISILLRAVDSDLLYRALYDIKRSVNPYIFMNIASLLSLLICFGDILRCNAKKPSGRHEEIFFYRKSFLNLSVIFMNVCYISFIYLYHDLEKLGNIPVGRN
ncbi:MAG TPA: hypothetical protein PKE39_10010 [Ignavibacteria bacterium]|nr:hypothetical protein [Ignavibacteria bacterium]HMQ99346.1 hypothetical protein [Ignavibacteria bacterium]